MQERTASLLYELKNVEQFEPWSPRFELEDPVLAEEKAARRKRRVERSKREKGTQFNIPRASGNGEGGVPTVVVGGGGRGGGATGGTVGASGGGAGRPSIE